MSRWKYFTLDEFDCQCGCGGNEMDLGFIDRLDHLREQCNMPLIVTSGYRCPDYNDEVSTTGREGPHTTGKAVDILANGSMARIILRYAMSSKHQFWGTGINQRGEYSGRFIHLDALSPREHQPRPHIWTY